MKRFEKLKSLQLHAHVGPISCARLIGPALCHTRFSSRSTELKTAIDDHWCLVSTACYGKAQGQLTGLPGHIITPLPTQITNRLRDIFRHTHSSHQYIPRILFDCLPFRRSRQCSHHLVNFFPHCGADDSRGVGITGYAVGGHFEGEGLSEPADSPFRGGVVREEREWAVGYNTKGVSILNHYGMRKS